LAVVELRSLVKTFGTMRAVDGLSIEVRSGELLALLGPSGCGKTTTLRMIAGLERPDSGQVYLEGRDITGVPVFRRNIGVVFQSFALFPHMTVRDNVAFGLRMRRVAEREIEQRVGRALGMVRLTGLEKRYPRQLSGGQQQRVAVARAIVIEPSILLLDEPLSNLDAKLRQEMRIELRQLQQEIGITTIFVTHDQEEALTLSDRMVLMRAGRIEQVGSPVEVYERPASGFAAGFLGQANFFSGKVVAAGHDAIQVQTASGAVISALPLRSWPVGAAVKLVIKQERVRVSPYPSGALANSLPAQVIYATYLGSAIQYICETKEGKVVASMGNDGAVPVHGPGAAVHLEWQVTDCIALLAEE
jgi:spermidine/putrescine ABC transporter ATP-binding subunit